MPYKILVIDDRIGENTYPLSTLPEMLEAEGYKVATSADATNAYDLVFKYLPDLIVLDVELKRNMKPPDTSGIDICRALRDDGYVAPIILVTAVFTETAHLVEGFEVGADDYVRLPCDNAELLARVMASLPRGIFKVNCRILIDTEDQRVWVAGAEVHFAPLEFKLLDVLVRNAPRIVPSGMLIDLVWEKDVSDDLLAVFISRLRKKIEPDPRHPIYIETIRDIGYRFAVRPARLRHKKSQRRSARSRIDMLPRRLPCDPIG